MMRLARHAISVAHAKFTGVVRWLRRAGAKAPLWTASSIFATGVVFWGGFNMAMESTNTLRFCISCHEMRSTVYEEFKTSVHFTNPSGVQAICSDCHVPKDWTAKLLRKIKASQELYHWTVGSISTPEKFEAKRPALAARVWSAMKASDSQECRNCHNFAVMEFEGQGRFAARSHSSAVKEGKTCIDCHKGISHQLPKKPKPAEATVAAYDKDYAQEINQTCAPCHGRQGQGTADGVYPRVAGLDPVYLARQIQHFKDKTRINIPMLPYATERELPEGDVKTIVAHFAQTELATKLGAGDTSAPFDALSRLQESKAVLNIALYPGDVDRGRRLYARECATCHGRDGYGDRERTIPQLAGQHSLYLKRQFEFFAKATRVHDSLEDAEIFKSFSSSEVDDILAYLSTLDD